MRLVSDCRFLSALSCSICRHRHADIPIDDETRDELRQNQHTSWESLRHFYANIPPTVHTKDKLESILRKLENIHQQVTVRPCVERFSSWTTCILEILGLLSCSFVRPLCLSARLRCSQECIVYMDHNHQPYFFQHVAVLCFLAMSSRHSDAIHTTRSPQLTPFSLLSLYSTVLSSRALCLLSPTQNSRERLHEKNKSLLAPLYTPIIASIQRAFDISEPWRQSGLISWR